MKKILILASASPRRREILTTAGYDFKVIPSHAEEIMSGASPQELARQNALAKARDVYKASGGNGCVIGADTVVVLENTILGKPSDRENALEMLKSLSGRVHYVVTGYGVVSEQGEDSSFCSTEVKFRTLTDEEAESYVNTLEPMDKAGGYGIQEKGCLLVEYIKGDFFNVVGLPISDLSLLLKNHNIYPNWQKEE